MEPEIINKFQDLETKIDKIYKSVEKTRKYFLATLIISLIFIVLPLIGLIFALPAYINSLNILGTL